MSPKMYHVTSNLADLDLSEVLARMEQAASKGQDFATAMLLGHCFSRAQELEFRLAQCRHIEGPDGRTLCGRDEALVHPPTTSNCVSCLQAHAAESDRREAAKMIEPGGSDAYETPAVSRDIDMDKARRLHRALGELIAHADGDDS